MLKGEATIQLFDAKTGNLTDEVKSNNMVTNAVKNILGGIWNPLAMTGGSIDKGGINSFFTLPSGMNFAQTFFGGLLIFGKSIDASPDHCLPSIEEIKTFVGCANKAPSVTGNSFKGSYNETESEVLSNGVKFVWDFTTEQANGDIASLCLTSDVGGAVGYGFDVTDTTMTGTCFRTFSNGNFWDKTSKHTGDDARFPQIISLEGLKSNAGKCWYLDGDKAHCIYQGIDTISDISPITKGVDNIGLGLLSGFQLSDTIKTENKDSYSSYKDAPWYGDLDAGYTCVSSEDGNYDFFRHWKSSGTKHAAFNFVKYSSGSYTVYKEVDVSNFYTAVSEYVRYTDSLTFGIFKDHIYVVTGYLNVTDFENKLRVWVIDFTGEYTYKDVEVTDKFVGVFAGTNKVDSNASSGGFTVFRDHLILRGAQNANGISGDARAWFLLDEDGTLHTTPIILGSGQYPARCARDSIFAPSPYLDFMSNPQDDYRGVFVPVVESAYLGTINNQVTVLTKDASKTMKIIYTLTQS